MASSASSSSSSHSSKTPGSPKSSGLKNTATSGSSPVDPMEGSSKSFNDQLVDSKIYQPSLHNRQSSKSSRHSASLGSGQMASGNRDAEQSTTTVAADEEYDDYDDESIKPISKRNSSHSHKNVNVHTECGRHSDDWLFGPLSSTVKSLLGKKDQK